MTNSYHVANLSLVAVWVMMPIITLFPVLISLDHFNYQGFQRVFGDLVSSHKRDTVGQMLYNFIFIMRRMFIALVALDLKDYSSQQL